MSKLTDSFILRAVWHAVLKRLPVAVTQNYFGDGRIVGLCPNEQSWMRSSTQICTSSRKSLGLSLSEGQSMIRLKKLIAAGQLERESSLPGGAFYFWLPGNINQTAFERCLQLMHDEGLTEKAATIANYDEIVKRVGEKLMAEFGEIELSTDLDISGKAEQAGSAPHDKGFRPDGGDIGTGRIREIANTPYGDEEKWRMANLLLRFMGEDKDCQPRAADAVTLAPLNDDLIEILGRPNSLCSPIAECLRIGGADIMRKAEHEQAAVIHWMLNLYLTHGSEWRSAAQADLQLIDASNQPAQEAAQ